MRCAAASAPDSRRWSHCPPTAPGWTCSFREAGLELIYDGEVGAYRSPTRVEQTTGLGTRESTALASAPSGHPVHGGHAVGWLAEAPAPARSWRSGPGSLRRKCRARAGEQHGAHVVDVTVLLVAMRRHAEETGLPWEAVRAADAAAAGTREAEGLAARCSARCRRE